MRTLSQDRFVEGIRAVEMLRETAITLKLAQLRRAHHDATADEIERMLQSWLAEDNTGTPGLRAVAWSCRG
jgi:hypothetical protein